MPNKFNRLGIALTLTAICLLLACSQSGGSGLHIKSASTAEKDIAVKSAYAFPVTKTFTDAGGKMTTAVTYNIYVANYDLDAGTFAMTLDKPLASEDNLRAVFSLVGSDGTKQNAPLQPGTYSATADKFMKVESVGVVSRKGSADSKNWFDRSALKGSVKINSATADVASGDIDVTAGDNTIKGSFTAKILKRK